MVRPPLVIVDVRPPFVVMLEEKVPVGARVSTVAVTAGEVVRVLPTISMILAVKECNPSVRAAVV